jgi:hypothetical protein
MAAAAAAAFFNSPLAVCHLFVYYIEKWGWKKGSRTFFVLFLAFSRAAKCVGESSFLSRHKNNHSKNEAHVLYK